MNCTCTQVVPCSIREAIFGDFSKKREREMKKLKYSNSKKLIIPSLYSRLNRSDNRAQCLSVPNSGT